MTASAPTEAVRHGSALRSPPIPETAAWLCAALGAFGGPPPPAFFAGPKNCHKTKRGHTLRKGWPRRLSSVESRELAQRFEYWKRLRAPGCPYFLRSF